MEAFVTHRGRLALLDWSDVNTDLIIPARYLKQIERTGFGPLLFADRRYQAGGAPEADNPAKHGPELAEFPLNRPEYRGATVLLAGPNFGCGSSREHAVWAVLQGGYRAVIAPGKNVGFADIFESNAFQSGLLPIELDPDDWRTLAEAARARPASAFVTIDLRGQTVTLESTPDGSNGHSDKQMAFQIPESHRHRLLHGLDAIAETLLHEAAVGRYEQQMRPWMVPAAKS
jgi:3-isopropylmalate/(R)-2-methylmalate dehydratase small subunit